MSIQLTKPLVVPEFLNALVKTYTADPNTGATIPRPPFTMNLQTVVMSLFPGLTARANSCALHGYDLFISRLLLDSRGVDLPMAYDPICVMLSSLKPLLFNSLKNEYCFSDKAGA
jgi:hypothetical protein